MYADASQFAEDVRLIWSNCIQYNGADHPVSQLGKNLASIFEKKFSELKTLSFEDTGPFFYWKNFTKNIFS
jgi:hypothetical protein